MAINESNNQINNVKHERDNPDGSVKTVYTRRQRIRMAEFDFFLINL